MSKFPVLDSRPSLDPRNMSDYPIRPLLAALPAATPRSYTWALGIPNLDQNIGCYHCNHTGGCVGHGWVHEAAARPAVWPVTQIMAWDVYHEAQRIDEWAGEDYEGTSVLAGAKIMKARGFLREYRWADNSQDALVAISRKGPAVLGIPWFTGMFYPDAEGYVRPTGRIEGWHAILANAVNVKRQDVTLPNSWGDWGLNGSCRMRWDEFGVVMNVRGAEACIPTLR